ncbi:AAA domain-containing protein [Hydrogenophaga sp. R2]|uniref:AAA domain-containing protein n=1 Tax=Hydrogenophaga sp. R2 TaxID=3132827 RepID=UPI003CE760A6
MQALLQLEQREDQAQFKLKSAKAGIAERKRRGITWHPVAITREDIGFGGKVVLELQRPASQEGLHLFQVGRNAALFGQVPGLAAADQPTLGGVITHVGRNQLQLTTTREDLPDWVSEGGQLGIDLSFDEVSYREMNQVMSEVVRARGNRLAELRDVLLGARQARFDPLQTDDLFYPGPLNDPQRDAVRHVLSARDVAIIHGPPGTGKTTTLVQAIRETIRRERRVLVSAPSNTAVDLLTEKLAAHGVKVIRLGNPSRVSDLLLAHTLDARVMAHASHSRMRALRQTADQLRQTAQQHVRHFGPEERQQRQMLKEEARQLFLQADDLERFITHDVLDSVQVITCTLVGAGHRSIRDLDFETVFIDEAAQALEPGCWIAIARAQRVVLAGDHHQLPPTVKSEQAAREGLRETLFEKCIQRQPATARMLTVQYRMHEQIMAFSSRRFYGGQLQAHPRVRHADLAAYDPVFASDRPVEFLDTAGFGFLEVTVPESRSTANPEEAAMLLRRLNQLLATHDPADHEDHPLTLGVIAPYRAQINCLKDAIEQDPVLGALVQQRLLSVGTVDAFQGQERDIIAISLTRSNRQGEIGFLSDIRRMNVGMTRARRKLLMVGDSSTLGSHPFFQELLAHVQQIGGYRTAWDTDLCVAPANITASPRLSS